MDPFPSNSPVVSLARAADAALASGRPDKAHASRVAVYASLARRERDGRPHVMGHDGSIGGVKVFLQNEERDPASTAPEPPHSGSSTLFDVTPMFRRDDTLQVPLACLGLRGEMTARKVRFQGHPTAAVLATAPPLAPADGPAGGASAGAGAEPAPPSAPAAPLVYGAGVVFYESGRVLAMSNINSSFWIKLKWRPGPAVLAKLREMPEEQLRESSRSWTGYEVQGLSRGDLFDSIWHGHEKAESLVTREIRSVEQELLAILVPLACAEKTRRTAQCAPFASAASALGDGAADSPSGDAAIVAADDAVRIEPLQQKWDIPKGSCDLALAPLPADVESAAPPDSLTRLLLRCWATAVAEVSEELPELLESVKATKEGTIRALIVESTDRGGTAVRKVVFLVPLSVVPTPRTAAEAAASELAALKGGKKFVVRQRLVEAETRAKQAAELADRALPPVTTIDLPASSTTGAGSGTVFALPLERSAAVTSGSSGPDTVGKLAAMRAAAQGHAAECPAIVARRRHNEFTMMALVRQDCLASLFPEVLEAVNVSTSKATTATTTARPPAGEGCGAGPAEPQWNTVHGLSIPVATVSGVDELLAALRSAERGGSCGSGTATATGTVATGAGGGAF
jgi:hypothetical protein